MLTKIGRWQPKPPRCAGQPRNDVVHQHRSGFFVGCLDQNAAAMHMRVSDQLIDFIDGVGGDLGGLENRHVLGQRASSDEPADRRVAFVDVAHPIGVGAKLRVLDHFGFADGAKHPLGHRLDRARDGDETIVAGFVNIAG